MQSGGDGRMHGRGTGASRHNKNRFSSGQGKRQSKTGNGIAVDGPATGFNAGNTADVRMASRQSATVQQKPSQMLSKQQSVPAYSAETLAAIIKQLKDATISQSGATNKGIHDVSQTNSPSKQSELIPDVTHLRLQIAMLAEDAILSDPQTALQQGLDETLWSLVYQQRIQILRNSIQSLQKQQSISSKEIPQNHIDGIDRIKDELASLLKSATCFYRTLILELDSRQEELWSTVSIWELLKINKSNHIPDVKESIRTLIFNCLVFLGDIERYSFSLVFPDSSVWHTSLMYYEKALRILPFVARPHSKIAMMYSFQKNTLECVYHCALSVGIAKESAVIRDNLTHAFHKLSNDLPSDSNTWVTLILQYAAQLFLAANDKQNTIGSLDFNILEAVALADFTLSQTIKQLVKLATIFIVIASDLDYKFESTPQNDVAKRQDIRYAQTVTVAGLLTMASISLKILNEQCENETFIDDINTDGFALSTHLVHVSLVSTYLSIHVEQLQVLQVYSKQLAIQSIQHRLSHFTSLLANFVNFISLFADVESNNKPTLEDIALVGLECMRKIYLSVDSSLEQTRIDSDPISTRLSRIANLAREIAQTTQFSEFWWDEDQCKFMSVDLEERRRNQISGMRTLASERLKDQVQSLQLKADRESSKAYPFAVLDAHALIDALPAIKFCLMKQTCVIAIPIDVIHDLDQFKTGTNTINVRARECIRYLEQRFKYRSPFLVGQQAGEAIEPTQRAAVHAEDALLKTNSSAVFVPETYKGIMTYCLFVRARVKTAWSFGKIGDFMLVTDDSSRMDVARSLGISCLSVGSWRARYGGSLRFQSRTSL
ncbi:hypothetical protein QVD99_008124 [Batrachochytrium dendrobatidis]|nr:hypothetical protein O5D80_004724 [Batrachochytrium dendrobatidis]KAK5665286.1 hypothetical protein QVD99_008124 [Batrachochytrium dendrobatidis]